MKVKVLLRNPQHYLRETAEDIFKVPRNVDASQQKFVVEREYVRALNAAKLERLMAKPFLGTFGEQSDLVNRVCLHPRALSLCLSADSSGRVAFYNIPKRKKLFELNAHNGSVQGLAFHHTEDIFYSCCNTDQTVKSWRITDDLSTFQSALSTIHLDYAPLALDHHRSRDYYAVAGDGVSLFDGKRSDPVRTWKWGLDTVHHVRFNPIEQNLVLAATKENTLLYLDLRSNEPLRRVQLQFRQNSLCWNPQESFIFSSASEDYNLYTFDSRNLGKPCCVLRGHTNAALDVDYSPTGRELTSASYDGTIRIWEAGKSSSRDVYHTKRMFKVYVTKFSLDSRYIIAASTDFNMRLWKARASDKLGTLAPREKAAMATQDALKNKFASHPQVRRILKHRHLPKKLYQAEKEMQSIRGKQRRKDANRRKHEGSSKVPFVIEREKHIVREDE